ncbi:conjugal transfer protein TrbL family protein [Pontibacillus litoralis]|uniref:Uncharacterized protein n=1 Tax=Pontibacillus litoralis JSM 072002 TaxID=1385512 RepID=A0A0A5FZE9_9BACI|nr:conjugal transfer protein TrbL family protein [Pontibacillus litoralis]KGX85174.1 hypothetical protein N784_09770 [Pontibacillus litoralis JSM 072002]
MIDWIGGKFQELIEETLNAWVEDFMNWILSLINELVFNLPQNDFVDNTMTFFLWFTGIFAVVIALYKVIEYIINTQNGTQQYPLDEILLRVFKSSGAMLVLPWIFKIIVLDIALPVADYFAVAATDFDGEGGYTLIVSAITASRIAITGFGGIVLIAVLIFFLVVFCMFFYSVCVFYADYIIMQILIAPVALSMIADENNYFQVWWRELFSMVTSLLIKVFLLALIINVLFSKGNILLAIGAGALIIKTPSVLKNMWYAGGGTRAMSRGVGGVSSMGSRALLGKMIK